MVDERPEEPRWRIVSSIAWVDAEEDAVALVDLSAPRRARPILVSDPAARLWRALAEEPGTRAELEDAAQAPDAATASEFTDRFLTSLTELGLIEECPE